MCRLSQIVIPFQSRTCCSCLLAAVLLHALGSGVATGDQPISLRSDVPFTDHVHRHYSDREGLFDSVFVSDYAPKSCLASDGNRALCLSLTSTPLLAQDEVEAPRGDSTVAPASTISAGEGEVLVLYGLSSEMPAYTEWSGGIREGLQDAQGKTPNINVEFLDLSKFDDQAHTQLWLELMRQKYAQRDIRVLIPVLGATLRFATAHLRELFPNAAVVFTSVDEREAANLPDNSGITGIVYRADIGKTCELALQLRPQTRRFVFISGSSVIGKSLDQLARPEFESLGTGMEADYWNGVPLDELKRRVRDLPDDHVLVFLFYLADENGRGYVPAKVAAELCDESTVPVFGFYRTVLQHGIVGGHMIDVGAQAAAAGRMARQVFDGEDPDNLPIRGQELNLSLVHWKRLQHWNIPESNVPAHAILLYREPTLWESYRWQIVAIFAIVILQFVLIVALLLNRIQRRRAEESLQQRESQLRTLSGRLIGAQEDERRRVARELHDDLSQRLAVLAIETDGLVHDLGDDHETAMKTRRLKDQIVGVSRDVHALSHELHPSILDDLGLIDALEAKCQQMSQHDQLDVDFQYRDIPSSLPNNVALCLYRIAQECLRNVAKHSQTDRAFVSLLTEDNQIVLTIADTGIGFDVDQARRQVGLGMASIEERTRLVGGELSVRSQLREGTDITVRIPLEL